MLIYKPFIQTNHFFYAIKEYCGSKNTGIIISNLKASLGSECVTDLCNLLCLRISSVWISSRSWAVWGDDLYCDIPDACPCFGNPGLPMVKNSPIVKHFSISTYLLQSFWQRFVVSPQLTFRVPTKQPQFHRGLRKPISWTELTPTKRGPLEYDVGRDDDPFK